MKEIKSRINEFDHKVADCPFCNYWAYVRLVTKTSPDPLRDLKRHITNSSKNEALTEFLSESRTETPHLDYYKKHTSHRKVVVSPKREYDGDLVLAKEEL